MIADDCTLLLRIVNPRWVENDRVTSLAFMTSHGRPVSVFDGSMITPEDAFHRFEEDHEAYGVIGVTVAEVRRLGIEVVDDREPYDEHVSLVFPPCSGNQERRLARELRELANRRGWLYRPKARREPGRANGPHGCPTATSWESLYLWAESGDLADRWPSLDMAAAS